MTGFMSRPKPVSVAMGHPPTDTQASQSANVTSNFETANGRSIVTEHLGPNCTPERLAGSLVGLIQDEQVRATHREGYDAAMRLLGAGDLSPSLKAADQILEIIGARRQQQAH